MIETLVDRAHDERSCGDIAAAYRRGQLARLTPMSRWLALLAAFLALQLLPMSHLDEPASALGGSAVLFVAFASILLLLSNHDRSVRARARLTPVSDMRALRAQVDLIEASLSLVRAVITEPREDVTPLVRVLDALSGTLGPVIDRDRTITREASFGVSLADYLGLGPERSRFARHLEWIEMWVRALREHADAESALAETVAVCAVRIEQAVSDMRQAAVTTRGNPASDPIPLAA